MAKYDRHLFVCVHDRGPGHPKGSCAQAGGAEVVGALKAKVAQRGLKGVIRANPAGCLGQCAYGAAMVVYPEATWYGRVELGDVDEILEEHLIGGRPVERLVLADEQLTGLGPRARDLAGGPEAPSTGPAAGLDPDASRATS